jgi:hypothetical protein
MPDALLQFLIDHWTGGSALVLSAVAVAYLVNYKVVSEWRMKAIEVDLAAHKLVDEERHSGIHDDIQATNESVKLLTKKIDDLILHLMEGRDE